MALAGQLVVLAFAASIDAASNTWTPPVPAGAPQVQSSENRPFHTQLRPAPQADVVALEASLTVDDHGGARVTFDVPAAIEIERLFWAVNTRTFTYRSFRLTDDPTRDARRIGAFFRSAGVRVESDDALRRYLEGEIQRSRERPSGAARVGAAGADRVPAASAMVAAYAAESDDERNARGPRIADREIGAAQYTTCDGNAFNKIEIWEPARYVLNVAHLAETWTSAWWTGYPLPTATSSNMTPGCWSNPSTFVNTTWMTEACIPQLSRWNGGFVAVTSGVFKNYDFLFDSHGVRVYARAQIEHSGGVVRLSTSFYYDNIGAWNIYEGWFLSSVSSGNAVESCYGDPPSREQMCYDSGGTWQDGHCVYINCPLIVDPNRNGFDLTDVDGGVSFDLDGDGSPERTAWTRAGADDAWLAMDRNGNGVIDSGRELFGSVTPVTADGRVAAANGFEALKDLDGGASADALDGVIDARDSAFARLLLWTDRNHNGLSEPEELTPLRDSNLLAIRTDYRLSNRQDRYGNRFLQRAKAIWPDEDSFVYDVWLLYR